MDTSNWRLFSSLNLVSTHHDYVHNEIENAIQAVSSQSQPGLEVELNVDEDVGVLELGKGGLGHNSCKPAAVHVHDAADVAQVNSRCIVDRSKTLPIATVISRINVSEDEMFADVTDITDAEYSAVTKDISITATYGNSTTLELSSSLKSCELLETLVPLEIMPNVDVNDVNHGESLGTPQSQLYCGVCDIIFTREDNLVRHLVMKKHWDNITPGNQITAAFLCTQYHNQLMRQSKFFCHCCNFSPVTHNGLISHLKSQQHREVISTLNGPLYCTSCEFFDYEYDKLLEHFMSIDHTQAAISGCGIKEKKSDIKCMTCFKILHSASQFRQHMKRHAHRCQDKTTSKCRYCEFTGKRSTVSNHIVQVHCNKRPNKCEVCDVAFNYEYDLRKHYSTRKHFSNVLDGFKSKLTLPTSKPSIDSKHGQARMKCNFCPFVTTVLCQLQSHYITHHEESCPLSEDYAVEHSISTLQECKACRFCCRAIRIQELAVHEVEHVLEVFRLEWRDTEECRQCFICYQQFSAAAVEDHIKTAHAKPKTDTASASSKVSHKTAKLADTSTAATRYHCTMDGCMRSYKLKGDLTVHMASHGPKKFVCDECESPFPTRKQLKAHSNTHRPQLMFNCDYCSYKCKTKVHLSRHMRIHAGSRPYTCPYCEYSSTTIGNLRKHILSTKKHSGASMYRCTVSECDYTSQTTQLLRQHLNRAHGILDETIQVKSTENDWIDVLEGHPIIPVQSKSQ